MRAKLRRGFPIFLASLNMRAGLVLIGPLIPILKNYYDLSNQSLAFLAAIPTICFAGASLIMKYVVRIGSSTQIIKWALTALTLASIGRTFSGVYGLYIFTILLGISIAVMNFEIPVWIKEHTESSAGLMTGIYVTLMGVAAAISVAITVPLAELTSLSWKMAMLPWIMLALISALYWWSTQGDVRHKGSMPAISFWRSKAFKDPIAWALVLFFGLESMSFYATATWFPTILTTKDFTLSGAALAVSISGLIGSTVGLAVPHYVEKIHDRRLILAFISLMTAVAFYMITIQSGFVLFFWLCISNIGVSIAFPLALLTAGSKSKSPEATRNISTMMQSVGYIISATGPFFMSLIFEATGSWNSALHGVVIVVLIQMIMGVIIGKPSEIEY